MDLGPTGTGLLLMVIGFGLAWIPLIGVLGGLVLFIGWIYIWNGRRDFTAPHPRNVVLSLVCVIVAVIVAVTSVTIFTVLFHPSGLVSGLALQLFPAEIVGGLGPVLTVLALARPGPRWLLWSAYGATMVVGAALAYLQTYLFEAAVGGLSPGSVGSLALVSLGITLLPIVPIALYLAAYYRIRQDLLSGRSPLTAGPPATLAGG